MDMEAERHFTLDLRAQEIGGTTEVEVYLAGHKIAQVGGQTRYAERAIDGVEDVLVTFFGTLIRNALRGGGYRPSDLTNEFLEGYEDSETWTDQTGGST